MLTPPCSTDFSINSYMFLWVLMAALSGTYMWGNVRFLISLVRYIF